MSETLFSEWDTAVEKPQATLITVPKKQQQDPNPCVNLYGEGEPGITCRHCVHLRYHVKYVTKYWKCDLRSMTHGAASDHRIGWQSCSKYEKRTEPYYGG